MRTPIGAPLNVISIVHRLTHGGHPLEHALFKPHFTLKQVTSSDVPLL